MSSASLFPQDYTLAASSASAAAVASTIVARGGLSPRQAASREAAAAGPSTPSPREVIFPAASSSSSSSGCSPRSKAVAKFHEGVSSSSSAAKLGSGLRHGWLYCTEEDTLDPLRIGTTQKATLQGKIYSEDDDDEAVRQMPANRSASGETSICINSPEFDSISRFSSPLLVDFSVVDDDVRGECRRSSVVAASPMVDGYRRPSHVIAVEDCKGFPLPPQRPEVSAASRRKRSPSATQDRHNSPSRVSTAVSTSSSRFSRLMDIFSGLAAPAARHYYHQNHSAAGTTKDARQPKLRPVASRRRSSASCSSHAATHHREHLLSPYEASMQAGAKLRSRASRARYGHQQAEFLQRAMGLYQSAQKLDPRRIQPSIERASILLQLVVDHLSPLEAVDQLAVAIEDVKSAQFHRTSPRSRLSLCIARAELTQALAESLNNVARGQVDASAFATSALRAAKDAMSLWEDIASEFSNMTDRAAIGTERRTLAAESALIHVSLAESCLLVATLSTSQIQLDNYHELVAIAFDQASAMTLIAKPASGPATINNPFLTKIHLVACKADLHRIVATRRLSGLFDELEINRIISDLQVLVTREKERSKTLRGLQAVESLQMTCQIEHLLGDVEVAYAGLLRRTLERAGSICGTASPMLKAGPTKRFLQREGSVTSSTLHPTGTTTSSISETTMHRLMDADQAYGLSEEVDVIDSGRRKSSAYSRRPSWMPLGDLSEARARRRSSLFEDTPPASHPTPLSTRRLSLIPHARIDAIDAEIQAEVLSLMTSACKHYQRALSALPHQMTPTAVPLKTRLLLDLANAKMAASLLVRSLSGDADEEAEATNLKVAETFALWAAKETRVADYMAGTFTPSAQPRTSGENDLRLTAALTMQRVQHLRSKLGSLSPNVAQNNARAFEDRCRRLPGGREARLRYLTSLLEKWGDLGKNALEEWASMMSSSGQ